MGDASGIGPEVIMKALMHPEVHDMCNALVVGDAERLRQAGAIVGAKLRVDALSEASAAHFEPDAVECIDEYLARLVVADIMGLEFKRRNAAADADLHASFAQVIEHADFLDQAQR